jgi:hypothetical protein
MPKTLFGKDSEAEKEIEAFKEIEQKGFSDEDKVDVLEDILPIQSQSLFVFVGNAISCHQFRRIY